MITFRDAGRARSEALRSLCCRAYAGGLRVRRRRQAHILPLVSQDPFEVVVVERGRPFLGEVLWRGHVVTVPPGAARLIRKARRSCG